MNRVPKYVGPKITGIKRKMTKEEIIKRFDSEVASIYSRRRPVFLPEYGYGMRLVAEVVKKMAGKNPVVADLGAGTGNVARSVLEIVPGSKVKLIDFSDNMLNEAPKVLKKFKGRYEIMKNDMYNTKLEKNSLDAVVSGFAIHHTRGDNAYKKLYKNIYKWLKPNGVFVCLDVVDGSGKETARINEEAWRAHLSKHFKQEGIERIFSNYRREDSPLSIWKHLLYLKQTGFSEADVAWKKQSFAVYVGLKRRKYHEKT